MNIFRISRVRIVVSLAVFTGLACATLLTLASSPTPALAKEVAAVVGDHPAQTVPRTVTLKDLRAGLDKLKSYRARLAWSFDGKLANGKPYTLSYAVVESALPASKQAYRVMTATQTPESSDDRPNWTIEMYAVSDTAYMSGTLDKDTPTCEQVPFLADLFSAGGLVDVANDAQTLRGVRLVKEGDRVNGILADQYALDTTTFLTRGVKSATGNMWVARDGGYVVKLALQATGNAAMLGEDALEANENKRSRPVEGKLTIDYAILDVNKEKPVALPAACAPAEKAAGDVPLPKSATGVFTKAGVTMFQSEEKPEALVAFFKKEMPANGWKAGETQAFGPPTQMKFTKGNRTVNVAITPNPTGKGLMVTIFEEE